VILREGLLQARGQIVFILALAVTTGVIIYLEALDTEDRIRGRIEEALVGSRASAAPVPEPVAERARAALRRAEEAFAADRLAPDARATLLTALSAAVQLGLVGPAEARPRADEVLAAIESDGTPPPPQLAAALSAAAAAFPPLQERIGRLPRA
jgi:hypothetical protein